MLAYCWVVTNALNEYELPSDHTILSNAAKNNSLYPREYFQ
jgi:hypothetical protein